MRTTFSRNLLAAAFSLSAATVPAVAATAQHQVAHKADALQASLTSRIDTVDAKLADARKAGRISFADAARMKNALARIRTDSAKYAKRQGFLSAGESASYNRTLDEIEAKLG